MKNEFKLRVTLKVAVKIALSFFVIGTLLFAMQILLGNSGSLLFLGLAFIALAVLVNSIIFLLALIDLIQKDRLESFYAICILLANIPIAVGYAYILLEHTL